MENVSYLCSVTDEVTKHRQLDAQTSRSMLVPYTENLGFLLIHMDEIWKPVLGYEGLYEVSSLGRVRSVDRCVVNNGNIHKLTGRIIKQYLNKNKRCRSYLTPMISLSKNGKVRVVKVSFLVCTAFHGKRPKEYQCMHLDGNPTNNNFDNLSWGTKKENYNEPIRRKRLSEAAKINIQNLWRSGVMNFRLKPCVQYTIHGVFVAEYSSIKEAGTQTNIDAGSISACLRGRLKTAGGYIWKLKTK